MTKQTELIAKEVEVACSMLHLEDLHVLANFTFFVQ